MRKASGCKRAVSAKSRERLIVIVLVAVLAAGCSGGGDDGSDQSGQPDDADAPETETTATTQSPASRQEDVRPHIEDLLSAWDESMTPILADPQPVADDPDHRLREELAEFFTDGSLYIQDLGLLLDSYISQDTGIRPGPTGLVQQTTLLHFTETADDDHISFVFCSFTDGAYFILSTGAEQPPTVEVRQGAGDAIRVDGEWRLDRLQRLGRDSYPAGTANPCPDLATSEAG